MKKTLTISCLLLLGILLLSYASLFAEADADGLRIRVVVNTANIRLKPNLESQVIGVAKKAQVFEVVQQTGDWYLVNLPADAQGIILSGYIHKSVVEELGAEAVKPRKAEPMKEEPKPEPRTTVPDKQKAAPPQPPQARAPIAPTAYKKFFVRIGGGYGTKKMSYDKAWSFGMYHENGQVEETYAIDSSGTAVDGGVGFFFMRNIGVEASVAPASGKTNGGFYAAFPHPFYFNLLREKEWTNENLKYSAMEVNLNLILRFDVFSKLSVYLGGGGTYFTDIKIDSLKVVNWNESGYPYFSLNVSPEYATYTQNTFGFNASGGFDFFFTESIGLNINVRYSQGEAKFDVEGMEITIQPGGVKATAGIKFAF